jgi:hypothetical protein
MPCISSTGRFEDTTQKGDIHMFYCFCWIFCKIDNYFQDRYWKKLGYSRYTGQDGKEWYVSDLN